MNLERIRDTWRGRRQRRGWLAAAGIVLLCAHLALMVHLSAHLAGAQDSFSCPVCTAGHHAGDLLPVTVATPAAEPPQEQVPLPLPVSHRDHALRLVRARGPPAVS